MITSLQNEKVKLARALQSQAKIRRKENSIVLEGSRLIGDAIQQGQQPDFVLYEPEAVHDDLMQLLQQVGGIMLPVSAEVMRHTSDTHQPQGILAVFPMPQPVLPPNPQHVLILDSVRDPGNLGTILRTAAAAGVNAVLLSTTCADAYNPKVLRSGMGAHFRVPVREASWNDIGAYCRALAVYLADSQGDAAYHQVDWTAAWALIIGSEAHGAGDEAARLAQRRVFIPMAAETESLNAAIAAAVILFEAARQKLIR